MPTCRLCLREVDSLVESHIYPRALNHRQGSSGPLAVVPRVGRVSKSQIGLYENFLCLPCERLFDDCDRHFVEFTRRLEFNAVSRIRHQPSGDVVVSLYEADGAKLQRFAIGTLLRAHLATNPFWNTVNLGPHYERLRSLALSGRSGDDEFAVVLLKQEGFAGLVGMSPQRTRIEGVNAYWLQPPGLRLLVKTDRRPFSPHWDEVRLRSESPVAVLHRNMKAQDLSVIAQLTDPHRENISRILRR